MARMRMISIGLGLLLAGFVCAAGPTMSYEPVWADMNSQVGTVPIRVEIKNPGPSTIGTLTAGSRFGSMVYPVELPTGADKIVTVYLVSVNSYDSSSLELKTSNGNVKLQVELKSDAHPEARYVGVISSTSGLLSSMRVKGKGKVQSWNTSCKPELAPDRSVAYQGLNVLVLAEGCERLSDGSVLAIQRYVLAGGQLVITGGASAPWLRDPRWDGLLPVKAHSTRTFTRLGSLAKRAAEPLSGAVSVTTSFLIPGANRVLTQDGTPLIVELQVGLGRVVFWAFDPFAAPLQTWRGRDVLIRQVLNDASKARAFLGTEPNSYMQYGGYGQNPSGNDKSDPFQTKMPPAWKICLILFGFLVAVIPINFFVLQKTNRREWAWITIPIVSLGFSGMIIATAGGLYSAGAARVTDGTVLVHDGMKQAVFVGEQQIFLPKAGVYDLGFVGVESAHDSENQFSMWGESANFGREPEMIDVGQVVVPRLEASNLTFRSLSLTQALPFEGRIWFKPVISSDNDQWSIKGILTNSTSLRLGKARILYKGSFGEVGDIGPGQTKKIEVRFPKSATSQWEGEAPPPIGNAMALSARAEGLKVGTDLGAEPKDKRGCKIVYTWSQK